MNSTAGERIKMKRLEKGYTLRDLEALIGVSASNISKWERGDIDSIKTTKLAILAKTLDADPLWLVGIQDNPLMVPGVVPIPEGKKIPILGEIACGEPILAEENWAGEVNGPSSADFCLRAKGDSMINARIFPGDLVFIKEQPDVENGEIAAVLIDGEATLKRVYKYDGRVELRPENPLYEVIQIEGDAIQDLRIMGKAVSFYSARL